MENKVLNPKESKHKVKQLNIRTFYKGVVCNSFKGCVVVNNQLLLYDAI